MDANPKATAGKSANKIRLDAGSFARLHRDYRDRLVNSITRFVRDRTQAEDIVARAFQIAWAKREMFRGEALPSTWIEAIARNEARDAMRREGVARTDSLDRIDSREIPAPQLVADELEKREDQVRLQNAVDLLPILYRRTLAAHFIDGLSIQEIASRHHVPPGTVLSRIFKGKQLLRGALERPDQLQIREGPVARDWVR